MSLNKYDAATGTLTTLANGQRIWLGTKAAHDAAEAAGTLPTNCLIAITDDGDNSGIVDVIQDGNMNPVTSNAVYDHAPFRFGIDEHGNYGYYKQGSNILTPFFAKTVTVHGGINEVVTVDSAFTVQLDSNGEGEATLALGQHSLTGSLSAKTFNTVIAAETTDVYCMPNNGQGILYWFGNEVTPLMLTRDTYSGSLTRKTSHMEISKYTSTSNNNTFLTPTTKTNLNNYSKINMIVNYTDTASYYQHLGYGTLSLGDPWNNSTAITPSTTRQEVSYTYASGLGEQYVGYETNCYPNITYVYALWLDPR